jgi:hypothetical protein
MEVRHSPLINFYRRTSRWNRLIWWNVAAKSIVFVIFEFSELRLWSGHMAIVYRITEVWELPKAAEWIFVKHWIKNKTPRFRHQECCLVAD